jgi:hypothetical protein
VSPTRSLPQSAQFALWFTAWVSGDVSLDDARDHVVAGDAEHHVSELPGEPELVPLIVALGRLRAAGATGAGIALPVPGDPLGLAGPGDFNTEAIDAGEGVVLDGTDLGLVPHRAGAGVVWSCHSAVSVRQVPDPSEADTSLRQEILRASQTLADLDVARWRPEVADELMALRRVTDLAVPRGMAPQALRLASLASRCRTIVDLALEDDGGSVTATEADQRRAALTPLDHAARRGLVAACSFAWQR